MTDSREILVSDIVLNGNVLIFSLAETTKGDIQSFSTLIRPIIMKKKESVYIPMFLDEKQKVDSDVWSAFSMLTQKGMFQESSHENYRTLLQSLANSGKKAFVIIKNHSERDYIVSQNVAKATLVFCKLLDNGRLVTYDDRRKTSETVVPPHSNLPKSNMKTEESTDQHRPKKTFTPRDYQITQVPTIQGIRRLVSPIFVQEGTTLYDSNHTPVHLMKKEVRNNGAYTYSTDRTGIWAKIYDDSYNSSFFEDKVRRMLKNPIPVQDILWTKDVLVDNNGIFRGYLLSSYAGHPLQTSILKRDGLEQYFPSWNKKDLCALTLTILGHIRELHKRGVLLGCINPAAIRVVNQNKVYFCDTDDYQIEGYPTLSYNFSFAAPENLGKQLYLTTLDSENFSVAELVFMILMTGKTPYLSGNANTVETIKRMRFPFYVKDYDERNPNLRVLPSMWRFMWSHLSTDLKRSFCNTFQRNLYNNSPGKRLSVHRWYEMVKAYSEELTLTENSEDQKLYPTTFRRNAGDVFYRCTKCGTEHPKFFFDPEYFDSFRVCNVCMDKPSNISYTCVNCGRTFIYNNRTALYHQKMRDNRSDWHDQRHCPECKAKKETCAACGQQYPYYELTEGRCKSCRETTVYERRTCSCGRTFTLTYADKKYYDSKGWNYPKNCEICRKSKKSGGGYSSGGSTSGGSRSSTKKRSGFFGSLFGF